MKSVLINRREREKRRKMAQRTNKNFRPRTKRMVSPLELAKNNLQNRRSKKSLARVMSLEAVLK